MVNSISNVSTPQNYMSFKALVPKAKYKGSPNLSEYVIKGIKSIKQEIVKTDNDILAKEGEIARENPESFQRIKLENQLRILNKFRDILFRLKDNVIESKHYYPQSLASKIAEKERAMQDIDERFLDILVQ